MTQSHRSPAKSPASNDLAINNVFLDRAAQRQTSFFRLRRCLGEAGIHLLPGFPYLHKMSDQFLQSVSILLYLSFQHLGAGVG